MGKYVKVMSKSDMAPGEMKTVVAEGRRLMVANIGGEFFAIDDTCTHRGCSLGTEGKLTGSVVTCGCHGGQFNVVTGKVMAQPPLKDEASYPVKIEGDDVLVLV